MLVQIKTLKQLFQRYRRPGNLLFAAIFLVMSVVLVSQIGSQTVWKTSTKFSSQPALWPIISLVGMTAFALLNWISAVVSPKIEGRLAEVLFWVRSLEFVLWFMAYVLIVPLLGYLPSTILFAIFLTVRVGYRTPKMIGFSMLTAVGVVVIFKSFLQVKVPGGQAYEMLPDQLRSIMLIYF